MATDYVYLRVPWGRLMRGAKTYSVRAMDTGKGDASTHGTDVTDDVERLVAAAKKAEQHLYLNRYKPTERYPEVGKPLADALAAFEQEQRDE